MDKDIPFFAIGNNELEGKLLVGDTALCPHCKKKRKVKYGTDAETGEVSKTLGFVNCGKESYLVSVGGKLL